VYFTFFI